MNIYLLNLALSACLNSIVRSTCSQSHDIMYILIGISMCGQLPSHAGSQGSSKLLLWRGPHDSVVPQEGYEALRKERTKT